MIVSSYSSAAFSPKRKIPRRGNIIIQIVFSILTKTLILLYKFLADGGEGGRNRIVVLGQSITIFTDEPAVRDERWQLELINHLAASKHN